MAVVIRKDLAYRRVAGELFVVDAAASRLHQLNEPAALIWEGLAAGRSESRILADLRREFEVDEEQARADISDFIGKLSKAGLTGAL